MDYHCIIENNTLISKGLRLVLENLGHRNLIQADLSDLITNGPNLHDIPNYLWMDISNEIKPALKVCKQILKNFPLSKFLVFCDNKDPLIVKDFLKTGISGYLLPHCNSKNIKEALQQCSESKVYIDPNLVNLIGKNLLDIIPSQSVQNSLTKREKEILHLIVDEYTTQEIAKKLFISFCTVETHRLHLIQKMGVRNTAGLVREALSRNIYQRSMNSMSF